MLLLVSQALLCVCLFQASLVVLLTLQVGPVVRFVEDMSSSELGRVTASVLGIAAVFFGLGILSLATAAPSDSAFVLLELVETQRDTILAGFVLGCAQLLRLVGKQSKSLGVMEVKLAAMKKQAEGAAKAYSTLLDENSREEVASLRKELVALKAQASNTAEQHLEALEAKKRLQRQLEDYELMFGDKKKKEM